MNLTIRPGRPVVGAAVLAAILAIVMPAPVVGAQPGPDDITADLCEPELEDCSPDDCDEVLVALVGQGNAAQPGDEECPGPDPCDESDEVLEALVGQGSAAQPGDEECSDPDPDPYDPPVPGEPNFTG